jgi:hypothetical protein
MFSALLRYSRRERRAVAQAWARRSRAAQAAARMARGPDADTLRRRTLHDARGRVVHEGCTYFGDGRIVPWRVVRSVRGRTDQFDVIVGERLWKTCGPRRVNAFLRGSGSSGRPKKPTRDSTPAEK